MDGLRGLEITDPHHHLWDLKANYYPWLTDRITPRVCGDYAAIRKNYLLADFRRDVGSLNLVRSVHAQAEHDHADPVRETRWLKEVAEAPGSSGIPHGIIAYADFGRPDIDAVLEGHCAFPNVRGIRQLLHEALVDPGCPRPSLLDDPGWRRAFRRIRNYPLSFDIQAYPEQCASVCALVVENPEVPFVLCHTGSPSRRDPEGVLLWRDSMRRLAELPNLVVKISGLGMFDRAWTVESIRPFVLNTIERFGVGRCMFASNFPVDGMFSTYGALWSAFSAITRDFTSAERAALFSENARRVYRV
jgi:predicted TIM-barrel fold metal-dependent hydrolase